MTKRDEKPKSDPVIQLTGRSYMASHFEEMLLGWSRKRGDKPSLLHEITLLVKEIIRRDQEHQGDLLRSAGSSEGHGKGEHADTVLNAVMAGLEGRWEEDGLHKNAVSCASTCWQRTSTWSRPLRLHEERRCTTRRNASRRWSPVRTLDVSGR